MKKNAGVFQHNNLLQFLNFVKIKGSTPATITAVIKTKQEQY
jgi:hypothetical protein